MSLFDKPLEAKQRMDEFLEERIEDMLAEAEDHQKELKILSDDIATLRDLQEILRGGEPLGSVG